MKIELKGKPTLSGLEITIVTIDFETGVVEYTIDGVGLRDINRGIHQTYLPRLSFGDTERQWEPKQYHTNEENEDDRPEI